MSSASRTLFNTACRCPRQSARIAVVQAFRTARGEHCSSTRGRARPRSMASTRVTKTTPSSRIVAVPGIRQARHFTRDQIDATLQDGDHGSGIMALRTCRSYIAAGNETPYSPVRAGTPSSRIRPYCTGCLMLRTPSFQRAGGSELPRMDGTAVARRSVNAATRNRRSRPKTGRSVFGSLKCVRNGCRRSSPSAVDILAPGDSTLRHRATSESDSRGD